MEKFRKVVQALLIGWGLVSFFGVVLWALFFLRSGDPDLREGGTGQTDKMTADDVRFILSTQPLDKAKLEKIVHSFKSARAFTGDHNDAVALKVTDLPVNAFLELANHLHAPWIRGDKADEWIRDALSAVKIREWQPEYADVLTENYFIIPITLVVRNGNVTAAELVYVNVKTQMVYYGSFKT